MDEPRDLSPAGTSDKRDEDDDGSSADDGDGGVDARPTRDRRGPGR
jgi:hypothetical protein